MVAALLTLALAGSAAAAAPRSAPDPMAWDADGPVVAMAAHGDRVFAAGEFYWVRERIGGQGRFRTSDGALRREMPEIGRPQVAVSDGAGGFYVAGATCAARIWHVDAAGREVPGFAINAVDGLDISTLFDIALSPDRRTVYASLIVRDADDLGETPMLVAFDARTGERTAWQPHDRFPDYTRDLEVSHDGRTLYAIGDPWWDVPDDSNLVAFDTATGARRPLDAPLDDFAFSGGTLSPDGRTLYVEYETEDYEYGAAAIDLTTGALRWELDTPVAEIEPAPDGNTVFVSGSFAQKLVRLDAATGALTPWRAGFTTAGSVGDLAISADGATLYAVRTSAAGSGRDISAVRVSDGQATTWGWQIGEGSVYDIALTHDGSELYVVGSFETLATQRREGLAQFDADGRPIDWDPIGALEGYKRDPVAIALSPDGGTIYVSSDGWDGITRVEAYSTTDESRLWEVQFEGDGPPYAIAPVLGGSRLIVAGEFAGAGGQPHKRLAAIDPRDGTVEPWAPTVDGFVWGIAEVGGAIVLGGQFRTVDGLARSNLAAVDAESLALLPWNPGSDVWVSMLEPRPERGTVLVGRGTDGMIAGVQRGALAEVRIADGTATTWNTSMANARDAEVSADGQLVFATGRLSNFDGRGEQLVALDGATGAPASWGAVAATDYFKTRFEEVELTGRGDVIAGGGFTQIARPGDCSVAYSAIARFAATTAPAPAWEPAPGPGGETGPEPDPTASPQPVVRRAAAADLRAPRLTVRIRGRRVTLRADEAATARVVARVRGRVRVRRALTLAAGTPRTVTIRLRRRAVLAITATDAAGNRATLRRTLRRAR